MPLPVGDFKYLNLENYDLEVWKNIILNYDLESEIGYTIVCDVQIPVNLHDKFNCYPPCPEKL
jgi:hypothetical protein